LMRNKKERKGPFVSLQFQNNIGFRLFWSVIFVFSSPVFPPLFPQNPFPTLKTSRNQKTERTEENPSRRKRRKQKEEENIRKSW